VCLRCVWEWACWHREGSVWLGVIWATDKGSNFAPTATFTGLLWDVQGKTVGVPEEKRVKYVSALVDFLAQHNTAKWEVERIYKKLAHAALVLPMGCTYLTGLETMLCAFALAADSFSAHRITTGVRNNLTWWQQHLLVPILPQPLPVPAEVRDIGAYSDTSSGAGIRIFVNGWWRAWRFCKGFNRDGRNIGWAEATGFKILLRTLVQIGLAQGDIIAWGDNQGVVEGWWNGCSPNKPTNIVFRRIHSLQAEYAFCVHTCYIRSANNPASQPSRSVLGAKHRELPRIPLPVELSGFLLEHSTPASSTHPLLAWAWSTPNDFSARERARRRAVKQDIDINDECVQQWYQRLSQTN
jgi:hypothetical protein